MAVWGSKRRARWSSLYGILIIGILLGWGVTAPKSSHAQGRASRSLRSVEIDSTDTGWDLTLELDFAVRYLRHSPNKKGTLLRIQVDPIELGSFDVRQSPLREILPLPSLNNAPILEISYDSSRENETFVEIQLSREMHVDVEQGNDFETLKITLRDVPGRIVTSDPSGPDTSKSFQMLTRAKRAIRDQDLDLAVSLLTKILETEDPAASLDTKREAREFLGLTHERNGQEAHARAEYELYLQNYPEGPAADRVRQRLTALNTAASEPRAALKRQKSANSSGGRAKKKKGAIDYDVFGSLALTYFRSESMFSDQDFEFLSTNVLADVDLASRARHKNWEVRSDFTGTYDTDIAGQGRSNDLRITRLSLEFEDRARGYEITLGRQRKSDGGALGRFDGLSGSYRFASHFAVSALVGLPVTSTSDNGPDTDSIMAGAALNIDNLWLKGLRGQLFVIGQNTSSIMDRTAIGGDIRYANKKGYSFIYLDYDVLFNSLNTLIASSTYFWRPDTDFRILLDRRNSPVLTVTTALQGQPAPFTSIDDLNGRLSDEDIRDAALDRTIVFWTGTAGVTHRFNEKFQISGDLGVTFSESSDGGEDVNRVQLQGAEAVGPDFNVSAQLLVNDWLVEHGVGSASLRYFEGESNRSFGTSLFSRFLLFKGFRVSPRLRWDWRESDFQGGSSTLRPSIETDWRIKSFVLNVDAGIQWLEPLYGPSDQTRPSQQRDTSYFVELGVRWEF